MANINAKGRSDGPSKSKPSATQSAASATAAASTPKGDGDADPDADKPAAPVDPFASVPVVQAGSYEVRDLTGSIEGVKEAEPRKYATVHATAKEKHLHMKQGWKHANAVFKIGSARDEKKATTVMGTIQRLVKAYGAEGIPAVVLCSRLRQDCMNNTRSHFAQGSLPPVGWAEGYVDGALNQNLIKVSGQMPNELAALSLATAEPAKPEGDANDGKSGVDISKQAKAA